MGKLVHLDVGYDFVTCAKSNCRGLFAMPEAVLDELRESHETFYCPRGHSNWYPPETEEYVRERDEAREELARVKKELELAQRALKVARRAKARRSFWRRGAAQ